MVIGQHISTFYHEVMKIYDEFTRIRPTNICMTDAPACAAAAACAKLRKNDEQKDVHKVSITVGSQFHILGEKDSSP